jgi:regulatory protein
MGFPRPKRKSYSEDELYEYAVGALARRMRTVAELKRLMRARIAEAESEYGQTLVELVVRRNMRHRTLPCGATTKSLGGCGWSRN